MGLENTTLARGSISPTTWVVEPGRPRSEGVLSSEQVRWCRTHDVAVAFDPVQIGWVTQDCEDDFAAADHGRQKFTFRAWRHEDAPVLAAMLSSEKLWHYLPEDFRGAIDEQTAAQLIELSSEEHHEVSAVIKDTLPIGQVRLLFSEKGAAELSYWLGEEYWGKGYASSVVSNYCERTLRERPEIKRLFARVHEGHGASQRVLEKAGFVRAAQEGIWLILERERPSGQFSQLLDRPGVP